MISTVWCLTELFHPDQTSTAYLLTRIAERLVCEGPVTVLCGPAAYDFDSVATEEPIDPQIKVSRVNVGRWNKNRLVARLLRSALLSAGLAGRLLTRARRGETVVLVTNPPLLLLCVAGIARLRGLRLILIVHDVYPEVLVVAQIVRPTGLTFRLAQAVFNRAYATADRLIVIGRDMHALLAAKAPISDREGRIIVVENWADTVGVTPVAREHGAVIRLQFAGNLGRVQGLVPLLVAFREAANPSVAIDLIGSGAMRETLKQFAATHAMTQVRIKPPFSRAGQREALGDCDIGIVSLAHGMCGLGVPSKAYNILAAGRPILFIGDPRSEIACMVSEASVGWVVANHGAALVTFLRGLNATARDEIARRGARARELAESRYGEERQLDAYASAIRP